MILKIIYSIIIDKKIISNAQFGFRKTHSSLRQIHRIVDNIASYFKQKHFFSGLFLDVAQAFDRVQHEGLLYKLLLLPTPLYFTLKSFLTNCTFIAQCKEEYSNVYPIKSGTPKAIFLHERCIIYTQQTYHNLVPLIQPHLLTIPQ